MKIWEAREYIEDHGFSEDGYVLRLFKERSDAVEYTTTHLDESGDEEGEQTTLLYTADDQEVWANVEDERVNEIDTTDSARPDWIYSYVVISQVEVY